MGEPVTFPLQEQAEPGLRWPLPGAGKKGVCVCRGRKNGGSVVLLENKLHPFSIFIRREDPERSSTRPGVCESNGDVSFLSFFFFFLNFCFCSFFL